MNDSLKEASGLSDIRSGLRQRITLLEDMVSDEQTRFNAEQEKAIATHKQTVDNYKSTISSYKRLLDLEEGFAKHAEELNAKVGPKQEGAAAAESKLPIPPAQMPLADFFCTKLGQLGAIDKATLRGLAHQAGYFGEDEGGRATHATLVNLVRTGRIFVGDQGLYELAGVKQKELLE